jgi:hypothetical protein
MRRLSLLGNLSSHGSSPHKSGSRDVFRTLDDNDSWSANLGSTAVLVKPQIERIGDNDEEWFSEAEQRNSGDDSPFSSPSKSRSPAKKRGSGKSHGSGKSMLAPARQRSAEKVLRAMANTIGFPAAFGPSDDDPYEPPRPQQPALLRSPSASSQSPSKKTLKRMASTDSCLQFDFAKARAIPSASAAVVPMEAFLSEFEATDAEEESSKRSAQREKIKKSAKDDPQRKQRRSERARKMEEAVDCSESESDYDPTTLSFQGSRKGAGRKPSMLGELSDAEPDGMRFSGHGATATATAASERPDRKSSSAKKKSSAKRSSSSDIIEPSAGSSNLGSNKSSAVRRSASEAVRPDAVSSSSRKKSSDSTGKTEKAEKTKPIAPLAPSKYDYESDASRRRPKAASRKPISPSAPADHHRKKDRERDDSDCSDDDSDNSGQRNAIPTQYQVKNNNGKDSSALAKKSPVKDKRRPSLATARPEDVVNAIRRRYSVSSSMYNTDTDADDLSVMTDDSEVSRRSSHRRSLEAWREKEKFKQQADSTFDSLTGEQKRNQNEKESLRQQILDQSRRGPVRSLSRQRSTQDAERSESTRMLGQLLGEADTSNNDSASEHERTGGGGTRMRRQSLELGYGQDTVYGSIDQIGGGAPGYLPSGLNHTVRRGSQCDRRGSQTGADVASDSMRNLMQTLAGSAKVDSKKTSTKKKTTNSPTTEKTAPKKKIANSPTRIDKTKEASGGGGAGTAGTTSHDKSIDEILKARRLRGATGRQKINPEKEEAKKFNTMNLLTAGMLFK